MIKKLLNTQTKSISFASFILAISYLASAFLGLLRDHLLAGKFGAGNELDVYYTAFTIPDFIALVLIFGAISAAIIPIFNSYYVKSKEEAWQYVLSLLNIFLLILIIICSFLIIFAPFFVSLVAPGFSESKKEMTVMLMRIMFLSPIILGVSNIISGILQVFHRFLVTALAPLMYNLGIIAGILFFVPKFGLTGLAIGVVFGAILHLLIQIPAFFYSGFKYKINFNIKNPGVLKTLKLMMPRSLGLAAGQLNTIVITSIASTLAAGSVAVFNLANNLSSMLVNAVAVSLSTAIFPSMALSYLKATANGGVSQDALKSKEDFKKKFSGAFLQIVFIIIPISFLIFILRAQIVRVILGTGKFGWLDTRLTAACLGIFSLGLCFQGLIFIASKTFYATHNTKIPAIISFFTVIFNILTSLLFIKLLSFNGIFYNFFQSWLKLQGIKNIDVIGLASAFTITAIAEALILLFLLQKKIKILGSKNVLKSLSKVLLASILMAIITLIVRQSLVIYNIVNLQTFLGVFLQLALSGLAGVVSYIIISFILKSPELLVIREAFFKKRILNFQQKLGETIESSP